MKKRICRKWKIDAHTPQLSSGADWPVSSDLSQMKGDANIQFIFPF